MIIITGSGGGIGNSVIQELSRIDEMVCLYHSRKPEAQVSGNIRFEQLDITDEAAVRKFASSLQNAGNITLVHFAALSIDGLVMTLDYEHWKKVMDVNLNGNFLLTASLLPLMIKQSWGRIIHISSVVGQRGVKGAAAYSASKTALDGWSKTLAREYARFNITSNILNLGYFENGLIDSLSAAEREKILGEIPAQRLGNSSNIVNAIGFLINSDYVSGSTIDIHGGL
ncbi:MAG: SDR family NAD(P)-dependent oxidoreductase [Chitinophagaceae bacterium]|nr:SDR family NAD(P)-dependent oxidoreductase [Chitinophagaceae bacterium]